ncbi:hypothetical protein [Halorubrum sp. Atlit-26R]|uniref:hypothetical protein n=1 Tax=Halorubrum sp. Atlit-26R TaxID=2282128 RepID=UPI000EF1F0B6|nr:hypothetical protein [Halorubrum sp. Atlit-26R]RLM68585.1 hypothetical protein DVK07_10720 [Halorubrum sp. Atlit-26R]
MGHPQPAVDFLTSVADEVGITAPEIPFAEWYLIEGVDAERGDDIRDHPEVWNKGLTLPDELRNLSPEDYIAIRPFEGTVNLNAAAIGLGLNNVTYEPKAFSGLVYRPGSDATIIVYGGYLYLAIAESKEEAVAGVEQLPDDLERIGIGDEMVFTSEPVARSVEDFMRDGAGLE